MAEARAKMKAARRPALPEEEAFVIEAAPVFKALPCYKKVFLSRDQP